jgi:hypothetical protein
MDSLSNKPEYNSHILEINAGSGWKLQAGGWSAGAVPDPSSAISDFKFEISNSRRPG